MDESLEDLVADVPELQQDAQAIVDALSCAESVETKADFRANIEEALELAVALVKELQEMKARI